MSTVPLEDLLRVLQETPPGASFDEVLRKFRPEQPAGAREAIRRCALVRWFDPLLYERLTRDVAGPPPFENFIRSPEVDRLQTNRWSIVEGERARLLMEWQTEPNGWRRWNTDLGYHFMARRDDPDAQLCAVYHLAASTKPERVTRLFTKLYDRADKNFDLAQCNALLEMLRLQEKWRGEKVSRLWSEYRAYRVARVQFADEWYKTGSYLERPALVAAFDRVFGRNPDDKTWVFHLHATGGAGKTTFLRWLTARRLVLDRVPCAKIDFDDFTLEEVQTYPTGLFRRIVAQLAGQPQCEKLFTLLERLRREEVVPGWNPDVTAEIRRQLKGAGIQGPVVVILDTLETVTLSAVKWLEDCVAALRAIHDEFPGLTLALSGRYDIAQRSGALQDGEYFSYDMPRFDEDEARRYLAQRGAAGGDICDAIIERAKEQDEARPGQPAAFNPFKLGMFAELALNRADITAEEIRRFPRVDVAYLIERVIKRIDSQPLRWMVRYGAIAQRLTIEFANEVLLPPLLEALRGKPIDDAREGLQGFESPDDGTLDVWTEDPIGADVLESGGMQALWDQLASYAREKGWLTAVTEDGQSKLRFHPEVVNPTRALLRGQPVFGVLQVGAASFFERKARAAPSSEAASRFYCGAVFHRFQAKGAQAKSDWLAYMQDAADRFGPAAAIPIAVEILGRDYCEAERIPEPGMSTPELVVLAHCRAAELVMQAAGLDFYLPSHHKEFCRHIEIALEVAGAENGVPAPSRRIYEAWRSDSDEKAAVYFRAAIPQAHEPYEQFLLEFQLAAILLHRPAPDTAVHLREALRLLPQAGFVGVTASDLHLALASHYTFLGAHSAAIEAMAAAWLSALDDPARARVLGQQAWYAVRVDDIPTARRRMAKWRRAADESVLSAAPLKILEERLAIMECEPFKALRACEDGLKAAVTVKDRARLLDQRAESRALLLEFRAASDDWDSAASSYDLAGSTSGSTRCALLSATMTAREMQDLPRADLLIASALNSKGSQDLEIQTHLLLLQAFVLCRRNQHQEGGQILASLVARPNIPAHIHASVLVFALVFGLHEPSSEFLESVLQSLSQIQPLGRTAESLEWTAYTDATVDAPLSFVNRLLGPLPRPNSQPASATNLLIRRADLYRIFGRKDEAAGELDKLHSGRITSDFIASPESRLLMSWRAQLARQRLGVPTRFRELFESAKSTQLATTSLHRALSCEAASEALRAGDALQAQAALDAVSPPGVDLPNVWAVRRADLLVELAPPADRAARRREAENLYQALGLPPRPASPPPSRTQTYSSTVSDAEAPQEAVVISDADLPRPLQSAAHSLEYAIDVLSADWKSFADDLRAVLHSRNAENSPVEVNGQLSALPWELGGARYRSLRERYSRRLEPPSNSPVHLFVSPAGEDEVRLESFSGFSLASVYSGLHVPFVTTEIRSLEDMTRSLFDRQPLGLIHIVAAVRQGSAGVYLDFGSTAHRVNSIGADLGFLGREPIPARMLGKILGSLRSPPFIVLEIAHPGNAVEAIRMMLLRNLFASELVETGSVDGVLACGLARPEETRRLTLNLVETLLSDCPGVALERLRAEPVQDIGHVLPRQAAALWTHDPNARIFQS